jgi:hypothetical protein
MDKISFINDYKKLDSIKQKNKSFCMWFAYMYNNNKLFAKIYPLYSKHKEYKKEHKEMMYDVFTQIASL